MSYILDALRRAERERHLGQTPTVQSLSQSGALHAPANARRWLRPALATLMLALLAGSAWMLLSKPPSDTSETAPPQTTVSPPPVVLTPPPLPLDTALPAAVETAAAADVIDEEVTVESLDDVAPPFPEGGEVAAVKAASTIVNEASVPPSSTASPAVAEPATAAPAQSDQGLPRTLREMPGPFRAGFPAIALDVHVYDADPARRWVMVGGRRYNEGEMLNAGPRILLIVQEGVVVEHAGERVLLPLNR